MVCKGLLHVRMQEYCSRQQGRHRPSVPKERTHLEEINSLLATMLCMCPCPKLNSRFCSRVLSFQTEIQSLRKPTKSSCGGFQSFPDHSHSLPTVTPSHSRIPTPADRKMSSVFPGRMRRLGCGIQDSQRWTCVIFSSPPLLSEGSGERGVQPWAAVEMDTALL